MHSVAGDNVGDFLRVRDFLFSRGRSGCERRRSRVREKVCHLLSSPLGLGHLISPDSKESQPGVNDCDADDTGRQGVSVMDRWCSPSGRFRRSSRRTVVLFPTRIPDMWRFFILMAAARILDIFCSMAPISGRRSFVFRLTGLSIYWNFSWIPTGYS